MSLRDWFAGQAMLGWLSTFGRDSTHPAHGTDPKRELKEFAFAAYAIADAMVAARDVGSPVATVQVVAHGLLREALPTLEDAIRKEEDHGRLEEMGYLYGRIRKHLGL